MEATNEHTAFSGKDWPATDAKFETVALSCCPHMHSVQTFQVPFYVTTLFALISMFSVTINKDSRHT
jgi:hypothetical protein